MEKRLYHITFWGSEDSRDCSMILTEEEADLLCRLEDELHPLKGYVPHIYVVDVEKSQEEARKQEEVRKEEAWKLEEAKKEETKKQLEHAMGLDKKYKSAMELAFEKAKKSTE